MKALLVGALAVALLTATVATVVPGRAVGAPGEADIEQLIAKAKTPADHEAIAAYYEKQATAARANAEVHRRMLASYEKAGGPLVEKWHLDHHCNSLIKDYESAAKMDDEMAAAHRKVAAEGN